MSVRDPSPAGTAPARPARLLPALAAIAVVLAIGIGFGGGVPGGSPGSTSVTPGPVATDIAAASTGFPSATPTTVPLPDGSAPPAGASTPAPRPDTVTGDVAIVPVTQFRTGRASTRAADVTGIADGTSPYDALVLVERDADTILATLGVARSSLGAKLVTVPSATALAADLAKHRTRLGFLRAGEVTASVRALAWGSRSLFGVGRVATLDGWPLTARFEVPVGATPAYDPDTAWTLFAGGDILLDRGVSLAIRASKAGADFPFDGGTATIDGLCKDCSPMGWDLPNEKRTGNAGAVREVMKAADIAIANLENPAPDNFRWHGTGTVFSANPKHIAGLANAGIDWVSLANNHIGDARRAGIVATRENLDDHGIRYSGAGRNRVEAHEASLIDAEGVTVGILGYDTIASYYHAGATTPGSAKMTKAFLKKDIATARKAGADVVIVFPHWGVEYRARPTDAQRTLAHAAIDAGADLVIGNHPHWVQGMEVYKGKPIWYALGNFVFDQSWSNYTMQGITLELTFSGTDLRQIRMRPHLILDKAQPNFLDPAGAGKFVMDQLWGASKGLLRW